jgi:hypothetical protein
MCKLIASVPPHLPMLNVHLFTQYPHENYFCELTEMHFKNGVLAK